MPKGHEDRTLSDPLNYSLEEYQVAKRAKRDPQKVKARLRSAWDQSDGKASFSAALWDLGFALARGDRRGFVAVDADGNIYSLSRWLGLKGKELKARLGDPAALPTVDEVVALIQNSQSSAPAKNVAARVVALDARIERLASEKTKSIAAHRAKRADLKGQHETQVHEQIREFARSQKSLRGVFQWLSVQRPLIVAAHKAALAELRHQHDLAELTLSAKQCEAIRALRSQIKALERERGELLNNRRQDQDFELINPQDRDALFTAAQIRKSPERILQVPTDTEAEFSSNDIRRALARFIPNHAEQQDALQLVLNSAELVKLEPDRFTKKSFRELERKLLSRVDAMAKTKSFGVRPAHMKSAITRQYKKLQKAVGAKLSKEQCKAIEHVLNRRQFAAVVGLAGAGKSTMLAAANEAWTRQGYRVLGGACPSSEFFGELRLYRNGGSGSISV